ncbi:MAG: hypothetical protein V2J89_02725 [Halieaceae bacterium]|nr:hypothetical protein [Halieaceae bacterium]
MAVETALSDAVGMLGTTLVVVAFYLLQLEKLDSSSLAYNLMNLLGAAFLLTSLCFSFNLASFVIELFWIGASLIGLWKIYRARSPSEPRLG